MAQVAVLDDNLHLAFFREFWRFFSVNLVYHKHVRISDEKISTALNKLSEKQRAFILLYYFYDMSDKEIAKLYHVSRSAVSYTRNKGLEKLKIMLSEKEML